MKNLIFILLFYTFTTNAQPNLILNGSFELNNEMLSCIEYFPTNYNTTVSYSNSFGSLIGLFKDSCLKCSPPSYWGGGAAEGNWMALIKSMPFSSPVGNGWNQSRLSFDLEYALSNTKNYKLSFEIKKFPLIPFNSTGCTDYPTNNIEIGISNSSNSFGTHIYSSPLGDSIWKQYSIVFNTQNEEEYITVQVDTGNISQHGVFIDNFVLVETTEPLSMQEANNNNKQLLKIVDILGRESKPTATGLLFYIYSDATVEKRIVVE
jgi:hypothetical protein